MKEHHQCRGGEHEPQWHIDCSAVGEARLEAECDTYRRGRDQQHRAELRHPGLEHKLRPGEYSSHQYEQPNADQYGVEQSLHE